ncbi:hypothetical protein Q0Z83_110940 [Actinoplanes sichuanensis]|nr:hypothetical protein Q0Z83_110940 [Actinoplanes sichuanensis]
MNTDHVRQGGEQIGRATGDRRRRFEHVITPRDRKRAAARGINPPGVRRDRERPPIAGHRSGMGAGPH